MSFMDAYKSLEKLCSEIYEDKHGVTSYIDEMTNTPVGSRYVTGWNEDLKQLKHYRWVRNQIVHEPGCTEDNMCKPEDIAWINNFHSRIMSSNDPLTQYRRSKNVTPAQNLQQIYSSAPQKHTYSQYSSTSQKSDGCLAYILGSILIIAAIVIIISIIAD